jgi:predicted transcriptional regulator of viral defense system
MQEFLAKHAVFTVSELDQYLSTHGTGKKNTRKALLTYYRKKGMIIPIRRGLYLSVPKGEDPDTMPVDPYLVAAKLQSDAVLSHHTALEFHGKAYSTFNTLYYTTRCRISPFEFRSFKFVSVKVAHSLQLREKDLYGVVFRNYSGAELKVTTFERTLVDLLNRPDLAGSLEEMWRSLESIEFFDLDQVVDYVGLLNNATTAAKVGFFLDQHRETLMVDETHLKTLHRLHPDQPHYFVRGKRRDSLFVKKWNLLVPSEIMLETWREIE